MILWGFEVRVSCAEKRLYTHPSSAGKRLYTQTFGWRSRNHEDTRLDLIDYIHPIWKFLLSFTAYLFGTLNPKPRKTSVTTFSDYQFPNHVPFNSSSHPGSHFPYRHGFTTRPWNDDEPNPFDMPHQCGHRTGKKRCHLLSSRNVRRRPGWRLANAKHLRSNKLCIRYQWRQQQSCWRFYYYAKQTYL